MSRSNLKYLIAFVVVVAVLLGAGLYSAMAGPIQPHDCDECLATGMTIVKCDICKGEGTVSAEGAESAECAVCGGNGYVDVDACGKCEGVGFFDKECSQCKGSGLTENECGDCDKGAVDCGICSGTGSVNIGNGNSVQCNECEGTGSVACGTCAGTCKVPCKWCVGGKTLCDTCDGSGAKPCDNCKGGSQIATFWALIPPVIAIGLALVTKEVYSSLFIGILSGALLYANFNPVGTFDTMINSGFIGSLADSWNAGIFLFLVILGVMVALINASGGAAAFGRWAVKNIKTRVGALIASFVLGVLIFIDDYFNCLTVGSVMTPITDRHKVSRAKLAYLIDATAAPICMIAPISSWAAAVSSVAVGTGESGIALFCRAIPYNFYSLLTFVFVICLVVMNLDYGPMKLQELNATVNGELGAIEPAEEGNDAKGASILDLLLPIIALIVLCVVGMIYVGGFFSGTDFISAFGNTDASIGLPLGAIVALLLTAIYLIARKRITFKQAMESLPKGFVAMVPAILILTFALSLKGVTGLLGADMFVGGLMSNAAAGLKMFLPAIIFLVACFLAFSTGTSWGTFGILIPIVTAVFSDPSSQLYIIGISACLAGAVCGDHCSPISDTTIMASAGAKCDHVTHVSTQLPYVLTVAAISFVCYILAGFIRNAFIVLPIGVALTVGTLFAIKYITKNLEEKNKAAKSE